MAWVRLSLQAALGVPIRGRRKTDTYVRHVSNVWKTVGSGNPHLGPLCSQVRALAPTGDAGLRETPVNVMQRLKDATKVFPASTVPNLSQKRRCPTSCRSVWPTPSTCQPTHLKPVLWPPVPPPTPLGRVNGRIAP